MSQGHNGHGHGGTGHDHHPPNSVGPGATRVILGIFFALCAISVVAEMIAVQNETPVA